jgi:acetoin utilization protein AcuB
MQPTIERYMTPAPFTIGASESMAAAHAIMREHGVRHLPVVERARVVGIVSERDLHLMETLRDVEPGKVRVKEAMTPDPYCVNRTTSLEEVAAIMAERKFGAVIVTDRDWPIGIFTSIDALRLLVDISRRGRAASLEPDCS